MRIRNMSTKIVRCDLDRCYRFNEYNKAMDYANKNMNVEGVREQIQKLQNEKEIYISNVKNITEPERETENQKYASWEKWNGRWNICIRITIPLLIIIILNNVLSFILPEIIHNILRILGFLIYIMVPASLVTLAATHGCESSYNRYKADIIQRINNINASFSNRFNEYYRQIDNLYLCSLDPTHREMVIMHREQTKYNEEMLRLERERNQLEKERNEQMLRLEKERHALEKERMQETKRTRQATEDMLQIERDREWRSRR